VTFTGEPEIRVRVGGAATARDIDGPAMIVVRPVTTDPALKAVQLKPPLRVTSSAAGVQVADSSKAVTQYPPSVDVEFVPAPRAEGQRGPVVEFVRVEKVRYPGVVKVSPQWARDPRTFDVIVTMPVETYLTGVLTHELFKDWPRQTFECQAVASRTYALHERGRARADNRPYDVEDSTSDQVYGGLTGAPVPTEAVAATRGMVLTHQGQLLRAYYSSTCGGRPNSASKVWPTGPGYEFNLLPPLQGQPRTHSCQASSWYRWEVTRTDDDVSKRLRTWGQVNKDEIATLTRVRAVEVKERNAAGRPVVFSVIDGTGRAYSLTSEELRMAFNQPVQGLASVTPKERVNSGDLEVEVYADQVRIRGRGWGHGVGMCQWCAKGMADAGRDWRSMVNEFYPGADVVKAY
jgi:stage II sporulation protein D